MTCKGILEKLQDYLDGDLKEKLSFEIESHLERCASCRKEYRTLKQISEMFRRERIQLPDEQQWQKTWKAIELQVAAPRSSWYRESVVFLDTLAMKMFSPQSLTLRVSFSLGLFALGIVLGSIYLSPSGEISQHFAKVEHKIKEVPVIQEKEIVKILEKNIPQVQLAERVMQRPQYVVLASKPIEPAPVFPASEESELKTETPDMWNPKLNVDKQIEMIKNELAPTFNRGDNSSSLIMPVSMTQ